MVGAGCWVLREIQACVGVGVLLSQKGGCRRPEDRDGFLHSTAMRDEAGGFRGQETEILKRERDGTSREREPEEREKESQGGWLVGGDGGYGGEGGRGGKTLHEGLEM